MGLQDPLVGKGNEIFKRDDVYLVGAFQVFFEAASGVEVSALSSFVAQNEIDFGILVAGVGSPLQLIIPGARR